MGFDRSAALGWTLGVAVAVLVAGTVVGITGQPGSATPDPAGVRPADRSGGDDRWVPYHQDDIAYAAGERCSFAVKGTVTRDREEYRNVAFWPDGAVHLQLFRGPLVIRWTNRQTHESVTRNQSGRALVQYDRDGALRRLIARSGHFGAGMPAGSRPGKGVYYIGGRWSTLVLGQDHNVLTLGPGGSAENLCATLNPH